MFVFGGGLIIGVGLAVLGSVFEALIGIDMMIFKVVAGIIPIMVGLTEGIKAGYSNKIK